MKLNNKLILLANLLAVNGHFVKRNFFNNHKIDIYKNVVPNSLEQIAKDASNGNRVNKLVKSTIEFKEPLVDFKQGKYIKVPLDDPFNLSIHCYNQESCGDYPDKVKKGSYYVANALEFYTPVNVNVTIFPFCNYVSSSNCESIMGITYPPTFIPLKETKDSEEFLYPQALAKQLNIDSGMDYDPVDFLIYLNSSYKPDADHDNRALIVTHEILHGLGFFHQINPVSVYISNYQSLFKDDFAIPPVQYVEEGTLSKYQGWTPFSIFDKYIVRSTYPNEYLYTKLQRFRDHSMNFEIDSKKTTKKQYNTFVNKFKELSSDKNAAPGGVEVAKLFKTLNAVGFRTWDGSIIELQTFDGVYESASSISHINAPFLCKNSTSCSSTSKYPDENYLMYFTVINNASTDRLISAFKNKSPHDLIGPDVIRILITLGWNEKRSTIVNNNQYSLGSDGHYNCKVNYLTILLSFAVLCITYLI
ncbi:hypothetical protein H8356DRAFT_1008280 [Neocallimastix lanati (nom. inval.)]|jgi:hypothetical protein|uniref:Zincin n=1 Tax=Neocallimastix californiae TaxID=1754190 RepID=A0A1Y2CT32_9FUNG|nr:hypothetical protein H8356DRAFT_1008280 [Neocallimastix sp. JGI-2020a]ORY50152.1 hypothetical protein LY90DRAFT_294119 [Neocallimastix californiae]|eukprot:ORY50152.1 hypothetical protein LY90DRAFT_294119 [Neocallimastix californiae]